MRIIDADEVIKRVNWLKKRVACPAAGFVDEDSYECGVVDALIDAKMYLEEAKTIDAIPISPLAVWLAGYHASPPEYALKETGALDPIDQASTVFTPNQIATAWDYHLRKLMESGFMA